MSELAALRPTNEKEERAKFLECLAAGETYEPQFTYADPQKAAKVRAACDLHQSEEFARQAIAVLEGIIKDHVRSWNPILLPLLI